MGIKTIPKFGSETALYAGGDLTLQQGVISNTIQSLHLPQLMHRKVVRPTCCCKKNWSPIFIGHRSTQLNVL